MNDSLPATRVSTAIEVSPSVSQPNGARYHHIDALRALAVMLVVVAHAGLGDIVPGGSGVTIFFAISGFIITHLILRERARSGTFRLGRFYFRRLLKLFPPFFVIILIPTFVAAFFIKIDWIHVASQVLFFYNWLYQSMPTSVLPGSNVVWSLSIEEQFYIVFALFWLSLVGHRRHLEILVAAATFFAVAPLALRLALLAHDVGHNRIYYGTDTRMDALAFGVLGAVVYNLLTTSDKYPRLFATFAHNGMLFFAVALYLCSLLLRDDFFRESFRYSFQAIATVMVILFGLLRTTGWVAKVLHLLSGQKLVQWIGLSSYSIYLAHFEIGILLSSWTASWQPPMRIITSITAGLLAGIAIWYFIEKPVERYKHRWLVASSV